MSEMEHEVFISYSSKNKNIADAIVADLEQHQIKCWYAPRDILVGEDWAGAIKSAIEASKIFILVYTDESNKSHQVTNEVTLAVNTGKIIIPFKLTSADMNDTLSYYLSSVHWLDAVSRPLSANIETLCRQIQALLDISGAGNGEAQEIGIGGSRTGNPVKSSGRSGLVIGILAAALVVCIGVFAFSGGSGKKDAETGSQVSSAPQETEVNEAEDDVKEEETEQEEEPVQEEAETVQEEAETVQEEPDTAVQEPAGKEKPAESEPAKEEKTAASGTAVMIPDKALSYNGHHYFVYNDIKSNWDEAAANCRDRGGYLAVVNDAKENEKIFKYMTAMGYDQAFFGLTYSHGKDDWVYLDGGTSDFRDWGQNSKGEEEPNNASGSEYHVQFDINMYNGHWNDAKFGAKVYTPEGESYKNRYAYICEWDQ